MSKKRLKDEMHETVAAQRVLHGGGVARVSKSPNSSCFGRIDRDSLTSVLSR
jgi:hypothetical protein